jgi:hypothetical protein
MKTIRIEPNLKNNEYSTIGYPFYVIIDTIKNYIDQYYWIISSKTIFNHLSYRDKEKEFDDYQNKYAELIIQENEFYKRTKKSFVTDYAEFFVPDWDDLFGYKNEVNDIPDEINDEYIKKEVDIYFQCIDGVYWKVSSQKEQILLKLKEHFPKSFEVEFEYPFSKKAERDTQQ